MPRVTEFSFTHDDFSLDGLFAICDELLIEVEVNLHGEASIACVDRMDRGFAFPVPLVISDYVSAWAMTRAGKAVIEAARVEHLRTYDPVAEAAAARADDIHDARLNERNAA